MKKLLVVGSNSIHTYNYIELVKDYFDDILLLTNKINDNYSIKSIDINFTLGLNMMSSIKKIKQVVKEFNPSIVHIHQVNSYAFITSIALRNSTIPTLLTAWGSDVLINPKKNIILRKILEYNLNNCDIITSDSLDMANEIKAHNKNIDIKIANFGIELEDVKVKKENIIYSNRLHKALYNIEKIIYGFNEFNKQNDNWKLVIGAIGEDTNRLKTIVKNLNLEEKVDFIGWVDTKTNNEYYQKAKIYVSIPSSDATAISLLEAISNNCICFVSNLPANCEHILDGINGIVEPNLDKIDFNLFKLIDKKLLTNVNIKRRYHYLKTTNRDKFISIYNELLGE